MRSSSGSVLTIVIRICGLVCLAILALGSSCEGPGQPQGVRMQSTIFPPNTVGPPCGGAPLPNVLTSGIVLQVQGPGSGTETFWSGHLTNAFGIDDHPNALTNATWNFSFDASTSPVPACGTGFLPNFFVPPSPTVTLVCGDCIP